MESIDKREAYNENNEAAKVGRAYGFFAYGGKTADIQDELGRARHDAQTPEEMELKLVEGAENVDTRGDSELVKVVERAKQQGMTHAFEASMPNVGNRRVSTELCAVMQNVYQSPLYSLGEQFSAGIVYKRGDKYCFRR